MPVPDLSDQIASNQIVLVTGATGGLGRAVTIRLKAAGAHVIALARKGDKLEALDDAAGGGLTLLPTDLTLPESIETLGQSLYQRFGRLDILVNCAAELQGLTPVIATDAKQWRRLFAINTLAPQRLIRSLDTLWSQSLSPQAVFMDCAMGRGAAFWSAYAATKAAQAAMLDAYRAECTIDGLKLHVFDPGPMSTALRRIAFPGEPEDAMPAPDAAADRVMALLG